MSPRISDTRLYLQRGDGQMDEFPVTRGGEVRVAFGERGRRSGVWKIVADPKGDVYVAERTLGKVLKISIHTSGKCHAKFGTVERSQVARKVVERKGTPYQARWERPEPQPGTTVTRAFTIMTTAEDMVEIPGDDTPEDVVWLPPPPAGYVGQIIVGLMKLQSGNQFRGVSLVYVAAMDSGQAVIVMAGYRPIQDDEAERFAEVRSRASRLPAEVAARANKMPVFAEHDGSRCVLDFALRPRTR